MKMTGFARRLQADLRARADEETRVESERYFKGVTQFIGVKRPGVNAVIKSHLLDIKRLDPVQGTREALSLLASPYMEMRQVGIDILHRLRTRLADDVIDDLAVAFDTHVSDWSTCDAMASRVLLEFLHRAKTKKKLLAWSRAKNPWRQRAVAVTLMREARRGEITDDVIAVCARIVKNPHRFVQLGAGWALRELSLADRPLVVAFIEKHAPFICREGLRYATEKMPAAVRLRVHDRHAQATRKSRRVGVGQPAVTVTA